MKLNNRCEYGSFLLREFLLNCVEQINIILPCKHNEYSSEFQTIQIMNNDYMCEKIHAKFKKDLSSCLQRFVLMLTAANTHQDASNLLENYTHLCLFVASFIHASNSMVNTSVDVLITTHYQKILNMIGTFLIFNKIGLYNRTLQQCGSMCSTNLFLH